MKTTLLIMLFCISLQGYEQINENPQILSDKHPLLSFTNERISSKKINYLWLQMNRIHEIQFESGQFYVFSSRISENQRVNLNLYSTDVRFGYLYEIGRQDSFFANGKEIEKSNQQLAQKKVGEQFMRRILGDEYLLHKLQSNLEYKHFLSLQQQKLSLQQAKQSSNLLTMALYIPSSNQTSTQQTKKYSLTAIVTTSSTLIDQKSFQKYIQYSLTHKQSHEFRVNLTSLLSVQKQRSQNQRLHSLQQEDKTWLLFHVIHVVGEFQYNISLVTNRANDFNQSEKVIIQTNCTESTFAFSKSSLQPQDFSLKQNQPNLKPQPNSQLLIEIRCISLSCNFISQIQKPSQIRKVVPGIPYIYSINQMQIFQIDNPLDLQIFIDMNKKNGLPQYEICSTKNKNNNQCIRELKNPTQTMHILQVKQKDDKVHALGRNNQIIINPDHQAYCYECSYFIALYAEYDNVIGMISFRNSQSSTIIPEGNSVTKVLKRNQTESYLIYGLESRLLFEKFSGKYAVYFQEVWLQGLHDLSTYKKQARIKLPMNQGSSSLEQNYYSVDLREEIEDLQKGKDKQIKLNLLNKIYKVSIETENNYPSTYYSMIVVNNQSRKIVLKDGVPFFNKQKNKMSVFKYLTENIETESFGTIIINSNQISQIGLQIYGDCLTLQQTQKSLKKYKLQKQQQSTLSTLRTRAKLSMSITKKKYQLQKIQNSKVNLMANRIDIIIEPQMCKSYLIKMINNYQNVFITYEILVSFIDSIVLPLNNQLPGILQYPGKIIQIYQVYVPEKCNLSVLINFCRSARSRMKIYKNKQALFAQNSDHKVMFNSQSQLQQSIYSAHAGVFFVTIQFFGFSNILQYTILVKQHQVQQGFYYIDLSKQEQKISYSVKEGRFFSTTYQLFFSPIFLKHWAKDVQRDVEYFQTTYFILESNSWPLLKRASNCKGQFFSDIVNHHQHFKQLKLEKDKLSFHPPENQPHKQSSHVSEYQRGYYSYQYQTSNPLSFLIIVPVIHKSNLQHQMTIIPYWQFDKKSRQPYQIIQLYNGKIYSVFEHWFVSSIIWAQDVVDFHVYESFIAMMIVVCSCLPLSCCLMICVYRTKVNIEFYANKLFNYLQKLVSRGRVQQERNVEQQVEQSLSQVQIMDHELQMVIPEDQNQMQPEDDGSCQEEDESDGLEINSQDPELEQSQQSQLRPIIQIENDHTHHTHNHTHTHSSVNNHNGISHHSSS